MGIQCNDVICHLEDSFVIIFIGVLNLELSHELSQNFFLRHGPQMIFLKGEGFSIEMMDEVLTVGTTQKGPVVGRINKDFSIRVAILDDKMSGEIDTKQGDVGPASYFDIEDRQRNR